VICFLEGSRSKPCTHFIAPIPATFPAHLMLQVKSNFLKICSHSFKVTQEHLTLRVPRNTCPLFSQPLAKVEPGQLSGTALEYGLDDRRFESRQRLGIFLLTIASIPALGPTHPLIQWVPGALSPGVERSGCEADHSFQSNAEVKECMELYLHSNTPSRRCAQLKQRELYLAEETRNART
jgi:hypothetical protein